MWRDAHRRASRERQAMELGLQRRLRPGSRRRRVGPRACGRRARAGAGGLRVCGRLPLCSAAGRREGLLVGDVQRLQRLHWLRALGRGQAALQGRVAHARTRPRERAHNQHRQRLQPHVGGGARAARALLLGVRRAGAARTQDEQGDAGSAPRARAARAHHRRRRRRARQRRRGRRCAQDSCPQRQLLRTRQQAPKNGRGWRLDGCDGRVPRAPAWAARPLRGRRGRRAGGCVRRLVPLIRPWRGRLRVRLRAQQHGAAGARQGGLADALRPCPGARPGRQGCVHAERW
mmetsp:Transcript_33068/g.82242  ORF Transcript_33068/g.82242 Transcript_33068/m.82242 type:complete len:289 (-) Transcript_33068:518-1384(-)